MHLVYAGFISLEHRRREVEFTLKVRLPTVSASLLESVKELFRLDQHCNYVVYKYGTLFTKLSPLRAVRLTPLSS